jgi:FkbM family methyltransferase
MPGPLDPHPLFRSFETYEGVAERGFEPSYFGARFRDWLLSGDSKGFSERRRAEVGYPPVCEEYFEWLALLAAVASAGDEFCMCEWGAGWGRWSIYGAMLCRQRRLPFKLIAVEPEPEHFTWLRMVLRDNGIDPDDHHLFEAAVVPSGKPVPLAGTDDPLHYYSHYVRTGLRGRLRVRREGHVVRTVQGVSPAELLRIHRPIDLVDMDIQGMEADVMESLKPEELDQVRIVHIGTHGRDLEARLERRFKDLGWVNAFRFAGGSERDTPSGKILFKDGVETWLHPDSAALAERLLPPGQPL